MTSGLVFSKLYRSTSRRVRRAFGQQHRAHHKLKLYFGMYTWVDVTGNVQSIAVNQIYPLMLSRRLGGSSAACCFDRQKRSSSVSPAASASAVSLAIRLPAWTTQKILPRRLKRLTRLIRTSVWTREHTSLNTCNVVSRRQMRMS